MKIVKEERIKVKGNFQFYNVGQGLFSTGIINPIKIIPTIKIKKIIKSIKEITISNINFVFVYDCGSLNKDSLFQSIDMFINKIDLNKELDILFISHIHYDHVNGINYLLRQINKVNYIILPYFDPIQRLLIALHVIEEYPYVLDEKWYFEFLYDPIAYLLDKFNDKIGKIILIIGGSSEEKENERPRRNFPRDIDNFGNYEEIEKYIDIKLEDGGSNEDYHKEEVEEKYKDKVFIKRHNGYISFDLIINKNKYFKIPIWFFKLFYLRVDNNKLKKFKDCIETLCKDNNINSIKKLIVKMYELNNIKEALKKCYERINININDTSLVVYHAPYNISLSYCMYVYNCCECLLFYKMLYKRCGQLLTGDIDLNKNKNYNEFLNYYRNYRKNVKVFQVPHHGSEKNWNSKILQDFPNIQIGVISAGQNNKYGHPDPSVIRDFIFYGKQYVWVHENIHFEIFVYNLNKI